MWDGWSGWQGSRQASSRTNDQPTVEAIQPVGRRIGQKDDFGRLVERRVVLAGAERRGRRGVGNAYEVPSDNIDWPVPFAAESQYGFRKFGAYRGKASLTQIRNLSVT